jgi:hypothetical protein
MGGVLAQRSERLTVKSHACAHTVLQCPFINIPTPPRPSIVRIGTASGVAACVSATRHRNRLAIDAAAVSYKSMRSKFCSR